MVTGFLSEEKQPARSRDACHQARTWRDWDLWHESWEMVQNVVVVIVGVELPNVERYIYESGLATRLLDGLTLSDSHPTRYYCPYVQFWCFRPKSWGAKMVSQAKGNFSRSKFFSLTVPVVVLQTVRGGDEDTALWWQTNVQNIYKHLGTVPALIIRKPKFRPLVSFFLKSH